MSAPPKVPRPSGTDELAVLRTAEAEASEIVNAARQERRARLKAAAVEAKAEIDEYRRQREERLAELGSEHGGAPEESRLREATDAEIDALRADYEANSAEVLSMILGVVTSTDNAFQAGEGADKS